MKRYLQSFVVAITLLTGSFLSYADSSVETLSPELRTLLSKEMRALQEGMRTIISAYISGDLEKIVQVAHKMKNSYILKQSITPDQKHELMTKLPKAFLQRDQKFHEYAGMLAHVAEEKHLELVGFYYSKLTESCVSCHSDYAGHQFPDFLIKPSHESDHH